MAQVFISYKADDRPPVQRLVQGLRANGLAVCWDQDIALDAPREVTIKRELDAARVVVVAWSNAAVVSEDIVAQARRARHQGKLIQIFLDHGCEPPLLFGERQGVNLADWTGNPADPRIQRLAAAAKAVIAGEKPPIGVGFAPKRRAARAVELTGGVIVIASATLGFIANIGGARDTLCSLAPLMAACRSLNVAPRPTPPVDASASTAEAQQKLVQEIDGVWCRQNDAVDHPFTLTTTANANGFHITVIANNHPPSTGDVDSVDTLKALILSHNSTAPHDQWQYHPQGSTLIVTDKEHVPTTYVRCTA
jgi:hypothetical protein